MYASYVVFVVSFWMRISCFLCGVFGDSCVCVVCFVCCVGCVVCGVVCVVCYVCYMCCLCGV